MVDPTSDCNFFTCCDVLDSMNILKHGSHVEEVLRIWPTVMIEPAHASEENKVKHLFIEVKTERVGANDIVHDVALVLSGETEQLIPRLFW